MQGKHLQEFCLQSWKDDEYEIGGYQEFPRYFPCLYSVGLTPVYFLKMEEK